MTAFAARLNRAFGAMQACVTPTNAPVQAPEPCPRGFEGIGCQVDINECARGTDSCPVNAACTNTDGGYKCACWPGYMERATSCERDAAAVQVRGWNDLDVECNSKRTDNNTAPDRRLHLPARQNQLQGRRCGGLAVDGPGVCLRSSWRD